MSKTKKFCLMDNKVFLLVVGILLLFIFRNYIRNFITGTGGRELFTAVDPTIARAKKKIETFRESSSDMYKLKLKKGENARAAVISLSNALELLDEHNKETEDLIKEAETDKHREIKSGREDSRLEKHASCILSSNLVKKEIGDVNDVFYIQITSAIDDVVSTTDYFNSFKPKKRGK